MIPPVTIVPPDRLTMDAVGPNAIVADSGLAFTTVIVVIPVAAAEMEPLTGKLLVVRVSEPPVSTRQPVHEILPDALVRLPLTVELVIWRIEEPVTENPFPRTTLPAPNTTDPVATYAAKPTGNTIDANVVEAPDVVAALNPLTFVNITAG